MNATTCRHWIGSDSTGRVCGSDAVGPLPYCPKHLQVQKGRAAKEIEKRRAQAARSEAAWLERNVPRLPQMRVYLKEAEAEYARRTASQVEDRAAYGGAMHPSVRRGQAASFSDSNVSRVVALGRIIERLRRDIARAEAVTS